MPSIKRLSADEWDRAFFRLVDERSKETKWPHLYMLDALELRKHYVELQKFRVLAGDITGLITLRMFAVECVMHEKTNPSAKAQQQWMCKWRKRVCATFCQLPPREGRSGVSHDIRIPGLPVTWKRDLHLLSTEQLYTILRKVGKRISRIRNQVRPENRGYLESIETDIRSILSKRMSTHTLPK